MKLFANSISARKTKALTTTSLATLLVVSLSACSPSGNGSDSSAMLTSVAGIDAQKASGPDLIPGRFIVTLADEVDPQEVLREHRVEAKHVYRKTMNGFAAEISEAARTGLLADSRVIDIEQDQVVKASSVQTNATWGLDRLDQRRLPLDTTFSSDASGAGVTAYIIDTGILYSHNEFGGRASFGFDAFGGNGTDCNGHGTHVSGTVGGATYGVAKDVNLVAVRVLDCNGSGSTSGVIAGVDWVAANHGSSAVANMSLGGGASTALDNAVKKLILSGVPTAVAAGNEGKDACSYSPARVNEAMTIGATSSTDARASWSNYGKCVDWFAPGVSITAAWSTGNDSLNTISGTSMASPHTAGAAALYLEKHAGASAVEVRDALLSFSTKGIVTSSNSANNHLLHSFEIQDGSGDYVTPLVTMTSPLDGATVSRRTYISLAASASDNVAVTKVEFYANGSLICTDTAAPFACSWRTPSFASTLVMQTKAYDAGGNVGTSLLATIKVR